MTEKEKFCDWLTRLLKEEFRSSDFLNASWMEAMEADANGMSYEVEPRYTLLGRPYLYRLS